MLLTTVVEAEDGAVAAGPRRSDPEKELQNRSWPQELESLTATLPIDVNADKLDFDQENRVVTATGGVHIVQTGQVELHADQAQYRAADNQVEASGNIRLLRQGDLFRGERALFDIGEQHGSFQEVSVNLRGPGGVATAESADFWHESGSADDGEGQDFLFLKNASFTNCECDPPPWHLTASDVEVDRASNRVTAQNMRLYAGDVPVFAFPWWRQPLLPKRESGLLAPHFRAGSNGVEVEVPYYWNIAPNQDATLALRSISRRGLMGNAQYRYLEPNFKGQLDASGIYDSQDEAYRGLLLVKHEHRIDQWQLRADLAGSRTRDFIHTFDQPLVDPHTRRLESAVTLNRWWPRQQGYSNLESGLRWYQDLEQPNDERTVQNLPYFHMTDSRSLRGMVESDGHNQGAGGWRLESDVRMDNFYQMAGDFTQRLDVAPVLNFTTPVYLGHFSTALGLRETLYRLNGDPNQAGRDREESLHRESALLSVRLDSTLRKPYGEHYLHTLEPSVQYVLNKASDQNGLPNYDASLRNFTVTDVFAHNLYSGVDRISDAQWVGYRLTSRLLNNAENNALWESGALTVGQRWAPEGNRGYQNGEAFSSVASSLEMKWSEKLSGAALLGYNPYQKDLAYSDVTLSVGFADPRPEAESEAKKRSTPTDWVRVGHHFNDPVLSGRPLVAGVPGFPGLPLSLQESSRERVEDLSLDASVRLSDAWIWNQRSDYSLESSGLKSWQTELVYEHECWNVHLKGGRNLATTTNTQSGDFIGLFINLQGLGGVGI
ncbi:MAG: LPS-assembly protein LptD [Magnetococcales bacterium]|nr:LPS-assembly protein LptD [Magnetococcales bacterium]